MYELIPVILGAAAGALAWPKTNGVARFVLSALAIIVSGGIATVVSGEYYESWIYLLLDFGEAALGLVIGYVVAALLVTRRSAGRVAQREDKRLSL